MANTPDESKLYNIFHKQCDYLLGFQVDKRMNKSILLRKWPRNSSDVVNDAYETPILAYNRELDVFVLANSITISNVEEESSPPYSEDVVINSKKEIKNLEYTTLMATPQFSTGSNELNDPPMAPNLAQYVRKRVWRCI